MLSSSSGQRDEASTEPQRAHSEQHGRVDVLAVEQHTEVERLTGGADPLPANGCYTRCEATTCPSGQVCRTVSSNPCGATEDGQVKSCMAVSQQTRVCLAG